MVIWSILRPLFVWPFGIFYDTLVYFSRFGMLYHEKSGNPDVDHVAKAKSLFPGLKSVENRVFISILMALIFITQENGINNSIGLLGARGRSRQTRER
jgi:hypothetical protein